MFYGEAEPRAVSPPLKGSGVFVELEVRSRFVFLTFQVLGVRLRGEVATMRRSVPPGRCRRATGLAMSAITLIVMASPIQSLKAEGVVTERMVGQLTCIAAWCPNGGEWQLESVEWV